jgi:hypothetical protein
MKATYRLFCASLLLAACKTGKVDDGYAIDLTLSVDATVTSGDLASATLLDLEVSGAETYSNAQIPIAGKFDPTSHTAGVRYKPGQTAGTITIAATLLDANGGRIATGTLPSVMLGGGTQLLTLTLSKAGDVPDGGSDGDMTTCGNGVLDPGEACDPGPGSSKPCPASANDCDDHNPCTTDSIVGAGCQAMCSHVALANTTGCMMGTSAGVCLNGACCTGCIKNGVCLAGNSDAKSCGAGGNACFDCTQNSATATCNGGNCSGCDATSCTNEGRTCGTSSCGYNCGGCPDGCSSGTLTHYACVNKSCQMNGSGNCGLYSACATASTCATSCTGDNGCVATAWCGGGTCKPKVGLGGACSAETTGDHECASPYACSWSYKGTGGYCVSTRCTGCAAANTDGSCNAFIAYGYDPRNYCQNYSPTSCHQNYCAGQTGDPQHPDPPSCDVGLDSIGGNWRPCGAVTCTNNAQGVGVLSGNLCQPTNQCKAATTNTCSNSYGNYCFPCNAAKNDCDLNAGFSC